MSKAGFASVVQIEAQPWRDHAFLHLFVFVGQKWRSLAILTDYLPARKWFATQEPGETDGQRKNEERACNCNGKDGLKMQVRDLAGQLVETGGCKVSAP